MADNRYDLFTPSFRAALGRMGVVGPFTAGMAVGLARQGSGIGTVTNADVDPNAPYYRLKRATGVEPGGWLSDAADPAVQAAQNQGGPGKHTTLDPEVAKLLGQLQNMRAQEKARGAEDTSSKPGLFRRVLDILGRPASAVEGAVFYRGDFGEKTPTSIPGGIGQTFKHIGVGFERGLTGAHHFSGAEQVALKHPNAPTAVKAIAGFGTDVLLDPLSYTGLGLANRVKQGANEARAVRETREGVKSIVEASGKRVPASELSAALAADVPRSGVALTNRTRALRAATATPVIERAATAVGQQAARTARTTLAEDLVRVGMARTTATKSAGRWLNPTAKLTEKEITKQKSWMDKIGSAPDTIKVPLDRTTDIIAREAHEAASRQMSELLANNLAQQTRKVIKTSLAGVHIGDIPIPKVVAATASKIAATPLAATAIDVFGRTFNTGSKFDAELTAAKARSAGLAERRIDVARRALTDVFEHTNPEQRRSYMEALSSGAGTGRGVLSVAGGRDAADVAEEVFDHVGKYIDWRDDGSGILKLSDLNRELPYYSRFDRTKIDTSDSPVVNLSRLITANREHLHTLDSAQFLYNLYVGVEKAVARDQLGRAVAEFGVPTHIATSVDPATGRFLGKTPTKAAQELVTRHGYGPIVTKGRSKEVSAAYDKHFTGRVFAPEVRKGITRILAIADNPVERGQLMRLYDKTQSSLKRFLTLPSPAFHLRNSFGDMWMGYLDDVKGARGAHSYDQAGRTMAAVRGVKGQRVAQVLQEAVDPVTGQAPDPLAMLRRVQQAATEEPKAGGRILKAPRAWSDAGEYLTAEELWAAFNHTGLNRGYVASDIEPGLRATNVAARYGGTVSDKLMDVSQARENYFRLAHFIDRLKRSSAPTFAAASEEAAAAVRKYHFDYSDVTPVEQAVFARIFPFYKFQRFAVPLVLQMFFARPGKILNTQRAMQAISQARGYGFDPSGLPTADQVFPEYMRDAMLLPLLQSATGNTVYFNAALPSSSIPMQTLGLSKQGPHDVAAEAGRNLVASASPFLLSPVEIASGHRVFGGGVPTGPLGSYFASRTPLTNVLRQSGEPGNTASLAGFLSGLGITENLPRRQKGEITREREQIISHRRRDKYTVPKKPTHSRPGYNRDMGR